MKWLKNKSFVGVQGAIFHPAARGAVKGPPGHLDALRRLLFFQSWGLKLALVLSE
jgi:hypothetical protein